MVDAPSPRAELEDAVQSIMSTIDNNREADIITALGDQTVEGYSDLAAALKDYKAGDTVTLTVSRGGQTVELSVTLDEKQPEPTEETEQTDSATTGPNTQVVPPKEDEPTYGELNPFDYFFGGN